MLNVLFEKNSIPSCYVARAQQVKEYNIQCTAEVRSGAELFIWTGCDGSGNEAGIV